MSSDHNPARGTLSAMLPALLALSILFPQPESPPGIAQPDELLPLAGPAVSDAHTRTLVEHAMTGRFEPIEGRPELAAALLLDLDSDTRERIRALSEARDVAIVSFILNHLDDLRTMTDAQTEGRPEDAQRILRSWWQLQDEGHTRLPLRPALAEILSGDQLEEVSRITAEYVDAWVTARKRRSETPDQAAERLSFEIFEREVRRAYDASLRTTRQAMEGIYEAVDPTDEQRETIREIVIEHLKSTRLKATPDQRRATMRRIYDALDDDRQALLFDYMTRAAVPD